MKDPLEKKVVTALQTGISKQQLLKKLSTKENHEDLVWYLNNVPTGQGRKTNYLVNLCLVLILLALTLKKLYFIAMLQLNAAAIDHFSPLLLIELIVPAINFFVLSKIIRYHRQGYQFMIVLGILALIRPENRIMPDLAMYLIITVLSVFLLLRLFPKQEKIAD